MFKALKKVANAVEDAATGKACTTLVVRNETSYKASIEAGVRYEDQGTKGVNVTISPGMMLEIPIHREGHGTVKGKLTCTLENGGKMSIEFGVEMRDCRDSVAIHEREIHYNGSNRATILAEPMSPADMNKLGEDHQYGRNDCEKDMASAVRYYTTAASHGDANAQLNLGLCYFTGNGVEAADEAKAVELFTSSAAGGNAVAACNLGYCHRYGRGTDCNEGAAVAAYKQASDAGYAHAQFSLAGMYATGSAGEEARDDAKALELYRAAAAQGHAQAIATLDSLKNDQLVEFFGLSAENAKRPAEEEKEV